METRPALTEADAREMLDELARKPEVFLRAEDVAPLLQVNPNWVRENGRLGYMGMPVLISGSQVKLPKYLFVRWYHNMMLCGAPERVAQQIEGEVMPL